MWFFKRKKRQAEFDRKDAEVQAIQELTFKKIDEATESIQKVGKLLEDKTIAEIIYKASGAARRAK